jgi:hypothetical protein
VWNSEKMVNASFQNCSDLDEILRVYTFWGPENFLKIKFIRIKLTSNSFKNQYRKPPQVCHWDSLVKGPYCEKIDFKYDENSKISIFKVDLLSMH